MNKAYIQEDIEIKLTRVKGIDKLITSTIRDYMLFLFTKTKFFCSWFVLCDGLTRPYDYTTLSHMCRTRILALAFVMSLLL